MRNRKRGEPARLSAILSVIENLVCRSPNARERSAVELNLKRGEHVGKLKWGAMEKRRIIQWRVNAVNFYSIRII